MTHILVERVVHAEATSFVEPVHVDGLIDLVRFWVDDWDFNNDYTSFQEKNFLLLITSCTNNSSRFISLSGQSIHKLANDVIVKLPEIRKILHHLLSENHIMVRILTDLVLEHLENMRVLLLGQHKRFLAHLRQGHVLFSPHRASPFEIRNEANFTEVVILVQSVDLMHY